MRNAFKTYWLAVGVIVTTNLAALGQESPRTTTNDFIAVEAAEPAPDGSPRRLEPADERSRPRRSRNGPMPVVVFGKDFTLRSNETAEVVVVIGGSSRVQGHVREVVVSIGGDVEIDGGNVGAEVVAVLGNVRIGPHSKVDGDVVSVGGEVDVAESATVRGDVQPVHFQIPYLTELRAWLVHCVLKLRLLAPQVGWVWMVFVAFCLFYLLVAVALPRPVQTCVDEINRRPATTFFMAILTTLLLPVVIVVLAATVVGALVVPFLLAALFCGALVGKVAFLEYLGFALGKLFGAASLKPALALVLGTALLALLYLVPILALVVFAVTGLWGLGAAVTVSFGSLRRESVRPNGSIGPTPSTMAAVPFSPAGEPSSTLSESTGASDVAPAVGAGFFAGTTPAAQPIPAPAAGEAYTLPRATFWERMAAAFLDIILAGVLFGFTGGPPFGFLVILAYFVGMWAWKGTTIGGIVANLKVVRLDDQPVTVVVALVRGLGAAFSAFVFFLGFLWIAWDPERQGWHDKIAGTVVVREPRGRPLV